jgi:phosphomannomutase
VAAVVITASHNPPQDNGYKVYDRNGAQIVPPADSEIAVAIAAVGSADTVPRRAGFAGAASQEAEDPYYADVLTFGDGRRRRPRCPSCTPLSTGSVG